MKKCRKLLYSLVILASTIGGCWMLALPIFASGGADVAIAPVYSSNQITKDGIFDVRVKPNTTQKLTLKLVNLSSYTKKVTVFARSAYTTSTGSVAIDSNTIPSDKTAKYQFRDLVKEKKQAVTLSSNEIKYVTFNVKVPAKKFNGIILGGFYAEIAHSDNPNSRGVSVNNNYAYAISAVLKEDKKTAVPKLTMGKIRPGKRGSQLVIFSKLLNEKPAIISGMRVDSTVSKKEGSASLGHTVNTGQEMAPNSNYNFANNWNDENIYPGTYHLSMIATTKDGHVWKFERDFKVSIRDAFVNDMNNIPWWIYFIVALIVLLVLITLVLIYRRYKKRKQ